MKVRILRSLAGIHGTFSEGDVVDLPPGASWVQSGCAEPISPEFTPKAATSAVKIERRGRWYYVLAGGEQVNEKGVTEDEAEKIAREHQGNDSAE